MTVISKDFGNIMKAREGDLIETFDGNIFDVKGLVHPPDKIIAFIRFTPDLKGERRRGSTRYKKIYPLQERYTLLREKFPQYLVFDSVFHQWLCEVPTGIVKKHYQPTEFLSQLRHRKSLDKLGQQTVELAELLHREAGVNWNALGVSGSLLAGLNTSKSDMDLVVYGSLNCKRVYAALTRLVREEAGNVRPYTMQDLKPLFDFRSKDTVVKFEDFVRTESRKALQGKFHQRDYFIRCVKDWDETTETYGSITYEPMGEAMISATVTNDSNMIFTPCTYQINGLQWLNGTTPRVLREIVSFRGRFCEQARKRERIIACGTVESVREGDQEECFRLIVGNRQSDFLILAQ
ncbi:MAG TPA: hypothetical protein VJ249_07005 [Candidatus Bathyarchaeia archaeon]|nr:hypothetical protein [Candidatus Bathyarchaeia archaeon]